MPSELVIPTRRPAWAAMWAMSRGVVGGAGPRGRGAGAPPCRGGHIGRSVRGLGAELELHGRGAEEAVRAVQDTQFKKLHPAGGLRVVRHGGEYTIVLSACRRADRLDSPGHAV